MSYLDNLEDNLKALERQEERDPEKVARDQARREEERTDALKRAPYAEALKKSAFTSELLTECRVIGRGLRVLVQFLWVGENLRLEFKSDDGENEPKLKRMELAPGPEGITAVFSVDGAETGREAVDLDAGDAGALARRWLTGD